ncbi:hypothetical protein [Marinomonas sp.]|uniref:hypothetical protein n=1 Tax=Marinomonas sp. TaxID=1904862 RepID=UPI003A8CCB8A
MRQNTARKQNGSLLKVFLYSCVWIVSFAYGTNSIVECKIGEPLFQENIRFVGLALASSAVLFGYLFTHLRDFRKQLKEDHLGLTRREVANLNHLVSIAYKKSIFMLVMAPTTAVVLGISKFIPLKTDLFNWYTYFCGGLVAVLFICIVIAIKNLNELDKFEKLLSNRSKSQQTSATLLKKLKAKDSD